MPSLDLKYHPVSGNPWNALNTLPGNVLPKSPAQKNIFGDLIGGLLEKGRAVVRKEAGKARENLVPQAQAKIGNALGSIFRQVRAKMIPAPKSPALSPATATAQAAEIRGALPFYIIGAVVVLVVGVLLARRA